MSLPSRHPQGTPEERLKALNYNLPPFPKPPGGVFVSFTTVGDLVYLSGQLPSKSDGSLHIGKVSPNPSKNGEIDVKTGKAAGRDCALTTLTVLRHALGSLDRVVRIVKATCMVNCTGDLKEPQAVANGYTEVMMEIFGEAGKSARSAIGHSTLPMGVPIEVEAIIQVQVASKL